jgi:4-hydroxy-3-methylbut-2-en-1-yl diphosphate reductase
MKSFEVPIIYRSPLISAIKKKRKEMDKMKKDYSPTLLDFGPLKIYLARHFGFCYGVENAIEIAFRTVEENPGKKIYLLSEMIHNPQVNADLQAHGVLFLQDTHGKPLIPFSSITKDQQLKEIGIQTEKYDTTCPFVEKVWNRSEVIAKKNYTIVIHGKPMHEETRATFSHAAASAPSVVVKDMKEAIELSKYITGEKQADNFYTEFKNQYSNGFDVNRDLQRIGVVNQTTMLASDTQAIADFLKKVIIDTHTSEDSFADTRDTLCYATNDNQTAVSGMLETTADLAIVVGGYNSSNTLHLVELCEERLPTYFISSAEKIISASEILHHNFHTKEEMLTADFLPAKQPVNILITSGASCPDAMVEAVIEKLVNFYSPEISVKEITRQFL